MIHKAKNTQEQCQSVCGDDRCELTKEHKGKHAKIHLEGDDLCHITWTTGGAERVNRERRQQLKAAE